MKKEEFLQFEDYLRTFKKKNEKRLGERTIHGVLTLAKHIPSTPKQTSLEYLKTLHTSFLKEHEYPLAIYSLWLYLKFLGYDEKTIRDLVPFHRQNRSAITDEERLARSVLTKKELLYLTEKIPNLRDSVIVRLLYDTGARVSELTNIHLKDLDLDTREVQVMGKGNQPRTVYFQEKTKDLLQQYLDENNIHNPKDNVFAIKPSTVWYNLQKYGKEILSRKLHPHMLRHSRLQHMADEGVDSFAIKSYAGHSDIGTTQIYIKNSKFQRKLAFEKAGNIWKS